MELDFSRRVRRSPMIREDTGGHLWLPKVLVSFVVFFNNKRNSKH